MQQGASASGTQKGGSLPSIVPSAGAGSEASAPPTAPHKPSSTEDSVADSSVTWGSAIVSAIEGLFADGVAPGGPKKTAKQ